MKKAVGILLAVCMLFGFAAAENDYSITEIDKAGRSEATDADEVIEEEGYDELKPLIDMADAQNVEGMGLEELTEAYLNATMKEYYNSNTGVCVQYPAVFTFDESGNGTSAVSGDGKAFLLIESMVMDDSFSTELFIDELKQTDTDSVQMDEMTGVIRRDRHSDDTVMLDLYLPAVTYLHHIGMTWPTDQQDTYGVFIEYMINSFVSDETEMG